MKVVIQKFRSSCYSLLVKLSELFTAFLDQKKEKKTGATLVYHYLEFSFIDNRIIIYKSVIFHPSLLFLIFNVRHFSFPFIPAIFIRGRQSLSF